MPVDALEENQTIHKYFHSYNIHPDIQFESQHSDEKVIVLVRRHPITFVPWIITSLMLFFIPFIVNVFLIQILSVSQVLFVNFFWFSAIFSYIFVNIISWLFNVGIITNERVIDIDYTLILNKEFTGTSIEDITDATARTHGFVRSLFNFGDVFVQTAGSNQDIDFLAVPHPSDVVSMINRLMR
jgi:uncharacterized membrane protein YdbT with pleckstrin-like domain